MNTCSEFYDGTTVRWISGSDVGLLSRSRGSPWGGKAQLVSGEAMLVQKAMVWGGGVRGRGVGHLARIQL